MPIQYTTAEAATKLGVAACTIHRHAVKLGLGRLITPRMRLLSEADVRKINLVVRDGPGNPNFGKVKP